MTLLLFLVRVPPIQAQSNTASDLVQISILLVVDGQTVEADIFCRGKTPGYLKKKRAKFIPIRKKLRKLIRNGKGDSIQFRSLKAVKVQGEKECKSIEPPTPTPTPTPSPVATPTPSVTPTPLPTPTATPESTTVFTKDGEVTAYGKLLLEIPAELSAQISQGETVYLTYCVGCHEQRLGRTFMELRTKTQLPPMSYTPEALPDQSLADLTAYLNRTRQ